MKISVVVPVYNAETWIEETLESVRQQGNEIEIILVDDGSRDRSVEVARAFLDRYGLSGQVLTSDENQGASSARNLGWRNATAEWIQFLDADDLLAPEKFRIQYAAAESAPENVAVLYSPWQHIAQLGGKWSPTGTVVRSDVDRDAVSRILEDRLYGYVGPTLVRRRALDAIDGFSPQMSLGEDLDLMLRLAMAGYKFQLVSSANPLFLYRDTPNSLWQRSAVDSSAVTQLVLSVREAEVHLRAAGYARLSESTKGAIAARYAERLDVLQFDDPDNFNRVLQWISDLHLRSAPPGSPLPARLVAMVVGLGNALRLRFAIRGVLRSLRSSFAK